MERKMSTILASVEKLERQTRETRRIVTGRLVIAAVSLTVAVVTAGALVYAMTSAGVLG
jgi:hypothetical protein